MDQIIDIMSEKKDFGDNNPETIITEEISDKTVLKEKGHPIPNVDYGLGIFGSDSDKQIKTPRPRKQSPVRSNLPLASERRSPQGWQSPASERRSPPGWQSPASDKRSQPGWQSPASDRRSQPGWQSPASDRGPPGWQPPLGGNGSNGSNVINVQSDNMPLEREGFVNDGQIRNIMGNFDYNEQAEEEPAPISYEDIRKKKIDYLAEFRKLKSQGYVPEGHKDITMTSGLEEMEDIVLRLREQKDVDSSIKTQRKVLIGFSALVEAICEYDEWNIFDLNLSGWSQNITDNISDYDDVFEQLYNKWGDVIKIGPEITLISMVVGSAYLFHTTKDVYQRDAGRLPGLEAIMQRDPAFRKRYQELATDLAREKQGVSGQYGGLNMSQILNVLGGNTGMGGNTVPKQSYMPQRHEPPPAQTYTQPVPERKVRQPMDNPDDVDGLLKSLNNDDYSGVSEEEIDLSELDRYSNLD
jgi:hypothetical protein